MMGSRRLVRITSGTKLKLSSLGVFFGRPLDGHMSRAQTRGTKEVVQDQSDHDEKDQMIEEADYGALSGEPHGREIERSQRNAFDDGQGGQRTPVHNAIQF